MIRTFVAVEVSPSVLHRASELIDECVRLGIDANWVSPDNMHLTLQFLGNVRENDTAMICRSVDRAVRDFPPFDVVCRGVGAFPSPERPRVIWIGMNEGREELIQLQSVVEKALLEIGYRGEARRFEPHLTIGRVRAPSTGTKQLAQFVADHEKFDASAFDVSEVLVFSSELQKGGPRHEVIGRAELRG
jgi:2'-5' RNA ligase